MPPNPKRGSRWDLSPSPKRHREPPPLPRPPPVTPGPPKFQLGGGRGSGGFHGWGETRGAPGDFGGPDSPGSAPGGVACTSYHAPPVGDVTAPRVDWRHCPSPLLKRQSPLLCALSRHDASGAIAAKSPLMKERQKGRGRGHEPGLPAGPSRGAPLAGVPARGLRLRCTGGSDPRRLRGPRRVPPASLQHGGALKGPARVSVARGVPGVFWGVSGSLHNEVEPLGLLELGVHGGGPGLELRYLGGRGGNGGSGGEWGAVGDQGAMGGSGGSGDNGGSGCQGAAG